jgi:hypothetical protein
MGGPTRRKRRTWEAGIQEGGERTGDFKSQIPDFKGEGAKNA